MIRYGHINIFSVRDLDQIPELRCEGGIVTSAPVDDQRTPAIRVVKLRRKRRRTPRRDLITQNLQSQRMSEIKKSPSLETTNTSHVSVTHGSDVIEVKSPPPPTLSPPLLSLGAQRRSRRRQAPSPVLRRSAEPARPAASSSQACKRRESQLKNQLSL